MPPTNYKRADATTESPQQAVTPVTEKASMAASSFTTESLHQVVTPIAENLSIAASTSPAVPVFAKKTPERVLAAELVRKLVVSLVERFYTELNPDFSAKSPNFRGFVLLCIEADFCIQICIFQHFSRTRRFAILCTSAISKFN